MNRCPSCSREYPASQKSCGLCGVAPIEDEPKEPDFKARVDRLEAQLREQPYSPAASLALGQLYMKAGMLEEAAEHFLRLALQDRNPPEGVWISMPPGAVDQALDALAELGERTGKPSLALELIRFQAQRESAGVRDLLRWVTALAKAGEPQAAIEAARAALARFPADVSPARLLRDQLKLEGGGPEITKLCEELVASDPRDAISREVLGELAAAEGDLDAALVYFRAAHEIDPDLPLARLYLAMEALAEEAEPDAALALSLLKGLRDRLDDRGQVEMWTVLDAAARRLQGATEAIEDPGPGVLSRLPSLRRVHVRGLCALARSLLRGRRHDDARSAMESALELSEDPDERATIERALRRMKRDRTGAPPGEGLASTVEAAGADTEPVKIQSKNVEAERVVEAPRRTRRARRSPWAAVTALLVLGAVVTVATQARGRISLVYDPDASVTLLASDGSPLADDMVFTPSPGTLQTSWLWSGTYHVSGRLEGSRNLEMDVTAGWWRRTRIVPLRFEPLHGTLALATDPAGATISIDDEAAGITPVTQLAVPIGVHHIQVAMQGQTPYRFDLDVKDGEHVDKGTVAFRGSLRLNSDPSGAEVYLEGESRGTTPLTLSGIPSKSYSLRLAMAGFGAARRSVTLDPGQDLDLGTVKLLANGSISVRSEPGGAEVRLNGEKVGITPLTVNDVPAGRQSVRVGFPDCEAVTRSVEVRPASSTDLGTLRLHGVLSIRTVPPGAQVIVDGEPQGVTPLVLEKLPARTVNVLLRHGSDYEDMELRIPLSPGRMTTKTVTLHQRIWLAEVLASMRQITGEAAKGSAAWPFELKQTEFDPSTGRWTGEIRWTTLASVHKVEGVLSKTRFEFSETQPITRGRAILGCAYRTSPGQPAAQLCGQFDCGSERGTWCIHPGKP